MKNILSIDPATETGWAVASDNKIQKWGYWILQKTNKSKPDMGSKLIRFEKLMNVAILANKIDTIVYEIPVYQHAGATIHHAKLVAIIELVAAKSNILVVPVDPKTIKKFITGNGNADKDMMVEASKNLGYTGDNNNEADAFCFLHYILNKPDKPVEPIKKTKKAKS